MLVLSCYSSAPYFYLFYLFIIYIYIFFFFFQNYIARFGHGSAKLARQAQSKEKTLAKMVAGGLTEKVTADRTLSFSFYSCGKIPPPVSTFVNVLSIGIGLAKCYLYNSFILFFFYG